MTNWIRETFYGTGTFQRPDTSGIRGKGAGFKSRTASRAGDEYPYGDDAIMSFGEPWAHSRDSAGHGPSHQNVPVPKQVAADDDRWDKSEAMGVPYSPRGGNRGGGQGRTLPGTGGAWASGFQALPPDDEMEEMGVRFTPPREPSDDVVPRRQGSYKRYSRTEPGMSWKESVHRDMVERFERFLKTRARGA